MDTETSELVTEITSNAVSSFIGRFDSEKQSDISTLIDTENQNICAIMNADAGGEPQPEVALSTALDSSRHRGPITNQEYRKWQKVLVSKESEQCHIKKEIKALDQALTSQFLSEVEEIRSELDQTLTAVLKDVNKKYRHHLELYTQTLWPLEKKLFSAERETAHLRAYLSPIRKLPLELTTHIISFALEHMSKRNLALVCKEWERVLLGTPAFWRRIDTNVIIFPVNTIFSRDNPLEYLQHHLHLAKSIELDVTIDYHNGRHSKWLHSICRILTDHGIERWRSLEIRNGDAESPPKSSIPSLFKGRFDRLRSLSIVLSNHCCSPMGREAREYFSPVYELIARTAPQLASFNIIEHHDIQWGPAEGPMRDLVKQLPRIFTGTPSLRGPKKLSIPAPLLSHCGGIPLDGVEELSLSYFTGDPSLVLPRRTTLWCSLPVLERCQKGFVQSLTVHVDKDSTIAPPMTFPMLEDLTLHGVGRILNLALTDLVAPSLRRLVLVGPEKEHIELVTPFIDPDHRSLETQINNSMVDSIFRTDNGQLHISPTDVEFYVHIGPGSVIAILDRWPQIERLKLYWNKDFKFTELAKALIGRNRKDPLAPNLLEIHVEMDFWTKTEVLNWKARVKDILTVRIRRQLPLTKITWNVFMSPYHRTGLRRGHRHFLVQKERYTGEITREEIENELMGKETL